MGAINSAEQLEAYRRKLEAGAKPELPTVLVCFGTGCQANGARPVAEAFAQAAREQGLELDVNLGIKTTGCHGYCENGPLVALRPQDILYLKVKPEDVPEIVEESVKGGRIVERLTYRDKVTGEAIARYSEIPFYKHQHRIALKRIGNIDPASIDDYILAGGYAGLARALGMDPQDIISEVERSGLRGRGGGGFPTGTKWRSCVAVDSDVRYVLCNGDEGDPGAFMDRSIMEGDPHCVIEGMVIGAFAVGAHQGYIYVRDEYPLAVRNLEAALAAAREKGLLGEDILGSGFSFELEIRKGAGAYVCGEETALIESLEGKRGCRLAAHADDADAVRAVRGDFKLKDIVVKPKRNVNRLSQRVILFENQYAMHLAAGIVRIG